VKLDSKKKIASLPTGTVCPVCHGEGLTWSEGSLVAWCDQTPWFDRTSLTPPPPASWRDQTCDRCKGAGQLDRVTGEPLWDRLIPSALPKDVRLRRKQTARGKRARGR
jgi:DnaJ-class molecular chaperone